MFDTFPNIPQKPFPLELAIQAEALACKLSDVLPRTSETANRDLVSILQSTCDLLEYLLEQQLLAVADTIDNKQQEDIASAEPPPEEIAPEMIETVQVSLPEQQPVLSLTAKELIKLSDWVLFAKAGGTVVQSEVLEEIYKQLIGVLAKEDVTIFLAQGLCDYERQMIVGTRHTDDETAIDHICSTVRPGYLFHEQLIRPQEVIVYVG